MHDKTGLLEKSKLSEMSDYVMEKKIKAPSVRSVLAGKKSNIGSLQRDTFSLLCQTWCAGIRAIRNALSKYMEEKSHTGK